MKFTRRWIIRHALSEGGRQLWRHRFLTLSTLGLGTLIVFLLNVIFGLQQFTDLQLRSLEARADFSVLMQNDYDSFQLEALFNALSEFSVTPTVAPKTEWNGFEIAPRLRVSFGALEDIEPVFEILKNQRYDAVIASWDTAEEREFTSVIKRLLQVRNATETAALWLSIIFIAGGILLSMNTFQLVVFSRREEVRTADLLGAEEGFILGPFLWEGALLGLLSAVFAILIFVVTLTQIDAPSTGLVFRQMWDAGTFALEIVCGAVVGGLGAYISARRFLYANPLGT